MLFTANPATGERSELFVNASYGLGEADRVRAGDAGHVHGGPGNQLGHRDDTLGAKELMIVAGNGRAGPEAIGGTAHPGPCRKPGGASPPCREPLLRDLAELAVKVERHFDGVPQDIEWAVAERALLAAPGPPDHRPAAGLAARRALGAAHTRLASGSAGRWSSTCRQPLSPLFEELYLRDGLDSRSRSCWRPEARIAWNDGQAASLASVNVSSRRSSPPSTASPTSEPTSRCTGGSRSALLGAMSTGIPALFREGVRATGAIAALPDVPGGDRAAGRRSTRPPMSDALLLEGVRELACCRCPYWFAAALAIGIAKVTDAILDCVPSRRRRLGVISSSGRFLQALSDARRWRPTRRWNGIADLVRGSMTAGAGGRDPHRTDCARRSPRAPRDDRLRRRSTPTSIGSAT